MNRKMTLGQFENLKRQLNNMIEEFETYYQHHYNDSDFDENLYNTKCIQQYLNTQNYLFSFDLSAIPFENWNGIIIYSDENYPVDLSQTRANIDFALIEYSGYGNFKNCKVKNLDRISLLDDRSFDRDVILENSHLFLMGEFSETFKNKFYNRTLTIEDLSMLNAQQLDEVVRKNLKRHIHYDEYNSLLIDTIGIYKVIELYRYSKDDYDAVNGIFNTSYSLDYNWIVESNDHPSFGSFCEKIKYLDVSKLKSACFSFVRDSILHTKHYLDVKKYPDIFIDENKDLFLKDLILPDDVRTRYFNKSLRISDLVMYPDIFSKFPIDCFLERNMYINDFVLKNFGEGRFQELVQKYSSVFLHLEEINSFNQVYRYLKADSDLDSSFINAVKNYFLEYALPFNFIMETNDGTIYNVPEWIKPMNFKFVNFLSNRQQLMEYDNQTCILNSKQRKVLEVLNVDNIKRFEQETGFFSHKGSAFSGELEMLEAFSAFFHMHSVEELSNNGIDFKNGTLSYDTFLGEFAKCLDYMRKYNLFTDYPSYDFIEGAFRDEHPEIFIDKDAPAELKSEFYRNKITPLSLFYNKEYIPYLIDKNLVNTINAEIDLIVPNLKDSLGNIITNEKNFINEFVSRYGNEKLLMLLAKYGISRLIIGCFNDEIENENDIELLMQKAIYQKILNGKWDYSHLSSVPEIIGSHPELFVNFDELTNIDYVERGGLSDRFYDRRFRFEDIKKYPVLVDVLKDKNLFVAFGHKDGYHKDDRILHQTRLRFHNSGEYSDLELLDAYGNEDFLKLCSIFGRHLDGIAKFVNKNSFMKTVESKEYPISFEELCNLIKNVIISEIKLGNVTYSPDDAPDFLKQTNPELFLDDSAPEELQYYFYCSNNLPLTFDYLHKHKDWLPHLKGKDVKAALLKKRSIQKDMQKFFEVFGEENAIKLGVNRSETVEEMLNSHQVDLMKIWYDKTGGKFIPDFVVMQNVPIEKADDFLISAPRWSALMKIKTFASEPESRDAMLKLAYTFGVFNQDKKGYNTLIDLLTGPPMELSSNYEHIINSITSMELMEERLRETQFGAPRGYNEYMKLKESLISENFHLDLDKECFSQIYRKNVNGSYTLMLNPQIYPKSSALIRKIFEVYSDAPVLDSHKVHRLFGGFEIKYDPEFRDFLLKNINKIFDNPEYIPYVSSVQKQFQAIKSMNSNRTLTWDLAISFVKSNQYESINVGNEKVAEISAIAGYTQEDFEQLQQIYNYGKQRTFSSIPRIDNVINIMGNRYSYEMLRLDDPLAMAIGTLSDCCQELNNCAEVCMEHSMVDKNGRVFVIRDEKGNVVAQSWVWRNKDVLCFDNIEIPERAFSRADKELQLGRKGLSEVVFQIYKEAAGELIRKDELIFKELLESNKITQKQYDGLRLGKITVGLGFNDIAETLKRNSEVDKGVVARPLDFEAPVPLTRGLYTSDSATQHIIKERPDRREYNGNTLPVHSDNFIEYDDSTFKVNDLIMLQRLEKVTYGVDKYLNTSIINEEVELNYVTEIAKNYGLKPANTKIILHPNFAIIYEYKDNKVIIGDLFFNTKIDEGELQLDIDNKVVIQIRLALDQISKDKEIDCSLLKDNQLAMYESAINLDYELDDERGVSYGR